MRFPFSHHHLLCFTSSTFPRRARKKISRSSTKAQTTPRFRKTNAKEEEDKEADKCVAFFSSFFLLCFLFEIFSLDRPLLQIIIVSKSFPENAIKRTRARIHKHATHKRDPKPNPTREKPFARLHEEALVYKKNREREREHAPRAIHPHSFFKGATVRIRIF